MITSKENQHIKDTAKLLKRKYRNKEGKFLVEGYHLVEEALKSGNVIEVFTTDENTEGTFVSVDVIKKLSTTDSPQPIVALVKKPEPKELGNKVLVLNDVQDPGNAGTLIRSALAFGFTGVLIQGVDIFNPKVVRSSQGAIFKIPIEQTMDVSFHFDGYETVGAILDKTAIPYNKYKPSEKMMLILGNEGKGISKEIINILDKKVYIPINFESLNVASAGAILLNEYR